MRELFDIGVIEKVAKLYAEQTECGPFSVCYGVSMDGPEDQLCQCFRNARDIVKLIKDEVCDEVA